jgi:hypothetical protein
MPAWSHRNVANEGEGPPAKVSLENGVARIWNGQHKEYMLCDACEQRFSRRENYVAGLASQPDGSFPASRQARWVDAVWRYEPGRAARRDASAFDREALAYFAASVLWRTKVATRYEFSLDLSEAQEVELRTYLLGRAPFPLSLRLVVELLEEEDANWPLHRIAIFPYAALKAQEGGPDVPLHWFCVPGLLFIFLPADFAPEAFRTHDLLSGRSMLVNAFREAFSDSLARTLAESTEKGPLAQTELEG